MSMIHEALAARYPDPAERRAQINALRYTGHGSDGARNCPGISGRVYDVYDDAVYQGCAVCYEIEVAESKLRES